MRQDACTALIATATWGNRRKSPRGVESATHQNVASHISGRIETKVIVIYDDAAIITSPWKRRFVSA